MKRTVASTVASLAISVIALGAAASAVTLATSDPAFARSEKARGGGAGVGRSASAPGHGGSADHASAGRSGARGDNRNGNGVGRGPSPDGFPQVSLGGISDFLTGRDRAAAARGGGTTTSTTTASAKTGGPAPHSAAAARLAPESSLVPVPNPGSLRAELGAGNAANASLQAMLVSNGKPAQVRDYALAYYTNTAAQSEISAAEQTIGTAFTGPNSAGLTDGEITDIVQIVASADPALTDAEKQGLIDDYLVNNGYSAGDVLIADVNNTLAGGTLDAELARIEQLELQNYPAEQESALVTLVSPKDLPSEDAEALLQSWLPSASDFGFSNLLPDPEPVSP